MEVLPLHKHQQFTNACAEILNKQWPRSMGARLHSLNKSCDTLPVSLAFVSQSKAIGFSKLSAVQGKQNSCLLESVVIQESDRGKGLGRGLMDLTEKYAKGVGVKTIYLNTIDKEGLYAHLGYVRCKPVISLGENAHRVPDSMLKQFMVDSSETIMSSDNDHQESRSSQENGTHNNNNNNNNNILLHSDPSRSRPEQSLPSIPPHTPLSEVSAHCLSSVSNVSSKTTAVSSTCNSLPPSLPPPPPPPPPPSRLAIFPSATQPKTSSASTTITRLDPKCVVWMKKDVS